MKYLILSLILIINVITASGQKLIKPESICYDQNNDRWLVSDVGQHQNMTDGKIYIVDDEGNIVSEFISGLADPKGIFILNDNLYVADLTKVLVIDLNTKEVKKTISIPNSVFLNDIVADKEGNLYISDTQMSSIFKIDASTEQVEKYATVAAPNGMLYESEFARLIIVSMDGNGSISELNLEDKSVKLIKKIADKYLDGITKDKKGYYYISSWGSNSIISFDQNFEKPIYHLKGEINGPADIYYSDFKSTLAIPVMESSKIIMMKLSHKPEKPEKLIPGNGSTNIPVQFAFSWSKSKDALGYIIHIAKDKSFHPSNEIAADMDSPDDTLYFHTDPPLEYDTKYFWFVEVIGEDEFNYSDTLEFHTTKNTCINDGSCRNNLLIIKPNPSSDYIEISSQFIDSGLGKSETIKIYNAFGKIVLSLDTNIISTLQPINISHLSNGIYYLKFGNETAKFIVMR